MTSYLPGTAPQQSTPSYAPQGTGMSGIQGMKPQQNPAPYMTDPMRPPAPPQQSFPGLQPGGLPSYLQALSPQEYAATTKAKREGTKAGKQFVKQPKTIAKKTAGFR